MAANVYESLDDQEIRLRISVDEQMGAFFHHIANMPPRFRARELLSLARQAYFCLSVNVVLTTELADKFKSQDHDKKVEQKPTQTNIDKDRSSALANPSTLSNFLDP